MADPVTLGLAGSIGLNAIGAGTILTSAGTLVGGFMKADAEEEMGRLQKGAADFEAQQIQMQAAESRASAQRQMFERQRLTKLALGTLQTRAAAGGGKATDENVLDLTSEIAGRGQYQALAELYNGENRARGLEDMAKAKRYEGDAKVYGANRSATGSRIGAVLGAGGTILSGLGSMARDYEMLNPRRPGRPLSLNPAHYG
jgi:hypothetical protein